MGALKILALYHCLLVCRKKKSITVQFVQETPGGYICGVDVKNFKATTHHRIVVRSWRRRRDASVLTVTVVSSVCGTLVLVACLRW